MIPITRGHPSGPGRRAHAQTAVRLPGIRLQGCAGAPTPRPGSGVRRRQGRRGGTPIGPERSRSHERTTPFDKRAHPKRSQPVPKVPRERARLRRASLCPPCLPGCAFAGSQDKTRSLTHHSGRRAPGGLPKGRAGRHGAACIKTNRSHTWAGRGGRREGPAGAAGRGLPDQESGGTTRTRDSGGRNKPPDPRSKTSDPPTGATGHSGGAGELPRGLESSRLADSIEDGTRDPLAPLSSRVPDATA